MGYRCWRLSLVGLAVLSAGCGANGNLAVGSRGSDAGKVSTDGGAGAGGGQDSGHSLDAGPFDAGFVPFDGGAPEEGQSVYAHSASELYRIDPDTLSVTRIAAFGWPSGTADTMTDLAIDNNGLMVGISYTKVYSVDPNNARCTYLSALDRQFNGLSFVPAAQFGPTGGEVLVGSANDGSFYRLNPATGTSLRLGQYGNSWRSSGDVVSVSGVTFATVTKVGLVNDWLARIDPKTGAATLVGDTGAKNIWGLGFWKDKVFGFDDAGQFLLLDVTTGTASVVQTNGVAWWGAAVTTRAVVTIN